MFRHVRAYALAAPAAIALLAGPLLAPPASAQGLIDGARRSPIPVELATLVTSRQPACTEGVKCPTLSGYTTLTLTSHTRCGLNPYIRVKSVEGSIATVRLRATGVSSCDGDEVTTVSKRLPGRITTVIEFGTGRVLVKRALQPRGTS